MEFPLAYCPHGDVVLDRLRALYEDRDQSIALAVMQVPSPTLRKLSENAVSGYCGYPDPSDRASFWDELLSERKDVFDDSIPRCHLSEMDQGLYGGLVGGEVRFLLDPKTGWVSSMVAPILKDLSEIDRLSFSHDSEWFKRYVKQMRVFVEASRGKFGIDHFILINGLNFVFELIGATDTYMALIDRPDEVQKAIDFAYQLNLTVQNAFFEHVPLLEGGTCSDMVQWIPGRVITESVDPFHMASVDCFEKWGRITLERIFSQFDGGVTHIHGNGRHLLEAVSSVKGLKAIYLGNDKGFAPAFDVLADLKKEVGDMPLVVPVSFNEFSEALADKRITGGVHYVVDSVPDIDTANRCMEELRNYRA